MTEENKVLSVCLSVCLTTMTLLKELSNASYNYQECFIEIAQIQLGAFSIWFCFTKISSDEIWHKLT